MIIYLSLHTIRRNDIYIDQAINTLLLKKYDSVISVIEEKDPVILYNPISLKPINISRFEDTNKISEKIYRFNGSFLVVKHESLINNNIFGKNIGHIETDLYIEFPTEYGLGFGVHYEPFGLSLLADFIYNDTYKEIIKIGVITNFQFINI